MKVTREIIAPELRGVGTFLRAVMPAYTPWMFRVANWAMDRFARTRRRKDGILFEEAWITRADGSALRLCIWRPDKSCEGAVGLLWMHGGGYAMGVPEQDVGYIRRFIHASGCVVVSPDYRRSTEAPYPQALLDCYAALLWLKENAAAYGVRDDRLFIGGDSAGGGLTAALALYARDQGEVAVAFQMPLYPMLDDRMDTPSARENDAPVWNAKSNKLAWQLYLGERFGAEDVPAYAAPARAEHLAGLPPACTFVGSIEPFFDETVDYMARLEAAGVPVHLRVYEGAFHAFDQMAASKPMARDATAFLMETFAYAVVHYTAKQGERKRRKD